MNLAFESPEWARSAAQTGASRSQGTAPLQTLLSLTWIIATSNLSSTRSTWDP